MLYKGHMKNTKQKLTNRLHVLMTDEDREKLERAASAMGVGASTYTRMLIIKDYSRGENDNDKT